MANRTTIRADTRFNTSVVTIVDQANANRANNYILMVDTGSPNTYVTYSDAARGGTWRVGAIGQVGAGGGQINFVDLQGGAMTIETEQQGGGMIQNLPCSRIRAVMGANPFAWVGENARGLLGMDNMDLAGLNVDPQKNAARNAARLARRV